MYRWILCGALLAIMPMYGSTCETEREEGAEEEWCCQECMEYWYSRLYLNMVKKCVLGAIYSDPVVQDPWEPPIRQELLTASGIQQQAAVHPVQLDALEGFMRDIIDNGIRGDFVETGVRRGGVSIFMRAFLQATRQKERRVWAIDPFEAVASFDSYKTDWLEEVKKNFERYGLLDDKTIFIKGAFKDVLPTTPIEEIALLRVDTDLYTSTREILEVLYPKVALGGYVIINNYGAIEASAQAVDDYREVQGIEAPLKNTTWTEIYWQKL